jgi:hypothetical protein
MSTILTEQTAGKAIATDEVVDGASTDVSDNALLEATEAETKKEAEFKAAEARVVDLAVQTLDPKDMLKKYAKLGKAGLDLANKRKDSLAAGSWNGKDDFEKVCSDLEITIRSKVAVKEVRMATYVRVYLWVEAVRSLVADVDRLSYGQVANKFLPMLKFDVNDLTGEIRKDWLTWVRTTVEKQLSDTPLSMKAIDASIAEREEEIEEERKRKDKRSPEKILEAEQKAANRKLIADRSAAQSKIATAVSDALTEGHADMADVTEIVGKMVKGRSVDLSKAIAKLASGAEMDLPSKFVGLNPETISIDDCKMLSSVMFNANKLTEMKYLRDRLDAMIKRAENAMITSNAG